MTILILEAKSTRGEAHDLATQSLIPLMRLLQTLGKRFTAVHRAVLLLEAASKSSGDPLQTPGIPPRDRMSCRIFREACNINSLTDCFPVHSTYLESPGHATVDGKDSRQGETIVEAKFSLDNVGWIRAANVSTQPVVAESPSPNVPHKTLKASHRVISSSFRTRVTCN